MHILHIWQITLSFTIKNNFSESLQSSFKTSNTENIFLWHNWRKAPYKHVFAAEWVHISTFQFRDVQPLKETCKVNWDFTSRQDLEFVMMLNLLMFYVSFSGILFHSINIKVVSRSFIRILTACDCLAVMNLQCSVLITCLLPVWFKVPALFPAALPAHASLHSCSTISKVCIIPFLWYGSRSFDKITLIVRVEFSRAAKVKTVVKLVRFHILFLLISDGKPNGDKLSQNSV